MDTLTYQLKAVANIYILYIDIDMNVLLYTVHNGNYFDLFEAKPVTVTAERGGRCW